MNATVVKLLKIFSFNIEKVKLFYKVNINRALLSNFNDKNYKLSPFWRSCFLKVETTLGFGLHQLNDSIWKRAKSQYHISHTTLVRAIFSLN